MIDDVELCLVAVFDGSEHIERGSAEQAAAERVQRRSGADAHADVPPGAALFGPGVGRNRRRLHHQRDPLQNGP